MMMVPVVSNAQSELRKPEEDPSLQKGSQTDLAAGMLSFAACLAHFFLDLQPSCFVETNLEVCGWGADAQMLQQQQLSNALGVLLASGGPAALQNVGLVHGNNGVSRLPLRRCHCSHRS